MRSGRFLCREVGAGRRPAVCPVPGKPPETSVVGKKVRRRVKKTGRKSCIPKELFIFANGCRFVIPCASCQEKHLLIIIAEKRMKRNLLIGALTALFVCFALGVQAQERATGKDYKDLKKQEKVLDKELRKKALKEARREAKQLEKEGFRTPVGKLPLAKQLENAWEKQAELDMEGNPFWYIASSRAVGGNQSSAVLQATNAAKIDLAGQIQTRVAQLIETKVAKLNHYNPQDRLLIRKLSEGNPVELDANDRLLIPGDLKKARNIGKEIVLISKINIIEIWDVATYDKMNGMDVDFAALAAERLGQINVGETIG